MICGVTAEIYVESYPPHSFSTALMSNKTFKTRIPRMAQIYGHCLILAVYLALLVWKVPFSHGTAQQEQKVNYVRCHFTEIRYEWQLPRKHCSINATSVFTESQKLSHEGSMLGAISSLWTVPHGKKPSLEQSLKIHRTYTGAACAGKCGKGWWEYFRWLPGAHQDASQPHSSAGLGKKVRWKKLVGQDKD